MIVIVSWAIENNLVYLRPILAIYRETFKKTKGVWTRKADLANLSKWPKSNDKHSLLEWDRSYGYEFVDKALTGVFVASVEQVEVYTLRVFVAYNTVVSYRWQTSHSLLIVKCQGTIIFPWYVWVIFLKEFIF